ncbi:flagellar brake domain-containing protein [Alteromonas antoniana]|uniref:flagellar brake domain-containing protein n=1 Tax=Alteromonas antoniana TaxID=2803813 RepID=UPI001C43F1EE|nr:PilZ domain-containing protein [Alteromonas antoniana]
MPNKNKVTLSRDDIQSLKDLVPGTTIDLQITTPTSPKRVKTYYVGMDIPNCMIFQMPTTAKWTFVRDLLLPDNSIVVRYILEGDTGQVIAFRVKVLKLLSHPTGLLLTTFPSTIQTLGLRAVKRAQPGIAVAVDAEGIESLSDVTGIIVDVSTNGCRIAMPVKPDWPVLASNQQVSIGYKLDGEKVLIKGQIKNNSLEQEYVYYGIQFDKDQKSVEKLLQRHILIG